MAYTDIDKPSDYFNTVLYTGNGVSPRTITGANFQPDFVWIRNRTQAGDSGLYDSIRGAGNNKDLVSESTGAEGAGGADGYGYLSGFTSDGFQTTTGTTGFDTTNKSGNNYATWNWKAGGTASSNTDGTITSSVSANTDSGFSICTYTGNGTSGATVGHGLTSVPSMLIVKRRNAANGWGVYHKTLGTGSEVYLNYTQGVTSSNFWITTPTTSVFSVSSSDYVNKSSDTYVAYCFADVKGYSKFGKYTGNGNADGTFVYTGFKPAWIMVKRTNSTDVWHILDNKRDTYNKSANWKYLDPASNGAEYDNNEHDFLSNGFKMRSTGTNSNASGSPYIYMAFAESPFTTSTGIPATAR